MPLPALIGRGDEVARRRSAQAAVLAAALLAGSAIVGTQAGRGGQSSTGSTRVVDATTTTSDDNPYWSGYVVTGPGGTDVSFTSIRGTFTVPAVTCAPGDAGASSAVWVGLGGYNAGSRVLEQVGIDANCDAAGKPIYFAWHELLPDIARKVKARVFPGDRITASVDILALPRVQLQIRNQTRRWTFRQKITWGTPDTTSAEWIMEAPANCLRYTCHQARLANFGSVEMTGIRAVGNASTGTLSDPAWTTTRIRLVPAPPTQPDQGARARPRPGATPGDVSPDGRTFDVSWVPNAKSR